MKRRTDGLQHGLRAALADAERRAIRNRPWRQHSKSYSDGPESLLGRLEAGQAVDVPTYRLHHLLPGAHGCDWVRLQPDGTVVRLKRHSPAPNAARFGAVGSAASGELSLPWEE